MIPVLGWLSVAAFVGLLMRQKLQREFTSSLAGLTLIFAILWFSCHVTISSLADPKTRLIVAVSIATTLVFAANMILRQLRSSLLTTQFSNGCHATQCLVLLTGSMSLLYSGVIVPAESGQLADWASAFSISGWWLIVSMLALWHSKRSGATWSLALSALLFAAAGLVLATPFLIQSITSQIQTACLLTFCWLVLASRVVGKTLDAGDKHEGSNFVGNILQLLVAGGIVTAVLTTTVLVFRLDGLYNQLNPAGYALALIAVANLASTRIQRFFCGKSFPEWTTSITFAFSLLAGQVALILDHLNITSGSLGDVQSV